ncbi:MAG: response regulator [Lachnospiraceae bacterium]|nr:response regulator [Lachnospiraceae bacterium]
MYSLIIAEDEFTTRRALVNMVKWNELGFCVDGEFADGQEVLEYLKSNTPDVILTDIKMTDVSGIEIARLVAEQNLPIQVVFLSAYKDFSYAQEAVEYNVAYYLLKPVDLSKLRGIFGKLKEKLDKQAFDENMIRDRAEHYERLMNYERQQFVTDAYFGALVNPDRKARRLGLISRNQENGSRLILVKIVLENDQSYHDFCGNYGKQELQDQIEHVLSFYHSKLEHYPITWGVTKEERLFHVGVFWENEREHSNSYEPQKLAEAIFNLMALRVEIPIFHLLESSSELINYAGTMRNQLTEENFAHNREYLQLLRDQNKLLCSYLSQNSSEQGLKLAETLFDNYIRGGIAFAKRQSLYTVTRLLDEIVANDLVEWNRLFAQCVPVSVFSGTKYNEFKEWMLRSIRLLFDYTKEKTEANRSSSIGEIMDYLRNHYSEDITLNEIAEKVYLNPAYISRLVKEQTGKNYTELVMEMRIDRAVELLKNTDMYVYEIAEAVGYKNLKYFYRVFRKIKGKSPNDYRPESK